MAVTREIIVVLSRMISQNTRQNSLISLHYTLRGKRIIHMIIRGMYKKKHLKGRYIQQVLVFTNASARKDKCVHKY